VIADVAAGGPAPARVPCATRPGAKFGGHAVRGKGIIVPRQQASLGGAELSNEFAAEVLDDAAESLAPFGDAAIVPAGPAAHALQILWDSCGQVISLPHFCVRCFEVRSSVIEALPDAGRADLKRSRDILRFPAADLAFC